ncbi:uncharacterized protein [Ciconia boyciana]|uniref:uncharacterized protein n=1 Tax=Ciconia boyciana TaxID=52775 RepID=UPI003BA0222B
MDEVPLGNMLLWRRLLLPSAAGTAEPRPGGRGVGGRGGEGGSREQVRASLCAPPRPPPSCPPQRRARPAAWPRLASPGPGRTSPGCRGPDLPRFTTPGRAPGPPWTEAAAVRVGRGSFSRPSAVPGGRAGWRALRPGPGLPAPPGSRTVSGRWLSASPGALSNSAAHFPNRARAKQLLALSSALCKRNPRRQLNLPWKIYELIQQKGKEEGEREGNTMNKEGSTGNQR